jgi:hypothetical protein
MHDGFERKVIGRKGCQGRKERLRMGSPGGHMAPRAKRPPRFSWRFIGGSRAQCLHPRAIGNLKPKIKEVCHEGRLVFDLLF